jgi:hypothetical protein
MVIDPEGNVAIHTVSSPGYALTVTDPANFETLYIRGKTGVTDTLSVTGNVAADRYYGDGGLLSNLISFVGATGASGTVGATGPGTISGTPLNTQVAYFTGASTFTGNAGLTYVAGGALTCSNDIVAYSDARRKKNLQKITDALSKIKSMNGYTYEFTDTIYNRRNAGVLAQEVRPIFPEVVYDNDDGTLSVAYGNMASLFIEAIKELEARVERLETQENIDEQ